MALTYRNTLRGHVVDVPEPADILAKAEVEAEKLLRVGSKRARMDAELVMDRANAVARHQRQTLSKMDTSRRWERYTAPPAPVVAVAPPAPPTPPAEPEGPAPAVSAEAVPVKAVKAARAEVA